MLFQHLTNIFKSFLIHGHVGKVLLIAVIVPFLKDKLGDAGCSDNYRSIFCIYIDELIKRLRRNKTGCRINGNFVGVIVYADDIVLLSPTPRTTSPCLHWTGYKKL